VIAIEYGELENDSRMSVTCNMVSGTGIAGAMMSGPSGVTYKPQLIPVPSPPQSSYATIAMADLPEI
jgi:hypothetical protein